MNNSRRPLKLALLGAAPDTGNLGVSALSFSVIAGIARRLPDAHLTVFDHGLGMREATLVNDATPFTYHRCGLRNSKRLYMPEALRTVQVASALGGLSNPAARTFLEADAVLDITGGDSFTDLYGMRRFRGGLLEKRLALGHSGGLILLPQTFGPYKSAEAQRGARSVLTRATLAIARDAESHERLRQLLGREFDPARHTQGVDVAFALPIERPPEGELDEATKRVLEGPAKAFGFNISGLCLNNPAAAAERFGFRADYPLAVLETLRTILRESDAPLLLVPHVVAQPGHEESDIVACEAIASRLAEFRDRVVVAPAMSDPRHAKWIISRCAWFCGTRMHATIAGLSSGVPTASIAYSLKTRGVFATCDSADAVADPRTSDTSEVIEIVVNAWRARDMHAMRLKNALPGVLARAESQMSEVVEAASRIAAGRDRKTA